MNTKLRWLLPAAAALLVIAPAFAQGSGGALRGDEDPSESRALPSKRATPQERAAARQERRAEGREAAREVVPGDAEVADTTAKRGAKAAAGPRKHFETAKERRSAERAQGTMGAGRRRTEPPQTSN